ncbi:MAG TPA: hypothetical protein VFF10_01860 [Trueperaceae bacterium]|nr:hypothetical protein [Trueperaceae bacterium]
MNRQIRRAQAKADKRAEEEKAKKRQARREKVEEVRARRQRQRESAKQRSSSPEPRRPVQAKQLTPEERKKLPGRFSGIFMFATLFFIALQAAVPADQKETGQSLIGAGFFLMYGYFATLYLSRRGLPRALPTAVVGGVTLAAVMAVMQSVQGQPIDWLMTGLGAVGVPIGAFLGRAVFNAAPRPQ